MRTVELVCSPPLEETVRAAWDRLAAAGMPSLARNIHPTNRPHLTLASVDEFPPGTEQRLADLCAAALPLPARLERVEVLDGSAPLVWLVRPVPELVALHGAVWDVLAGAPGQNPWHLPGRWIPHLSLALRFRDADRRLARALAGADRPSGEFVAARSYDGETRGVSDLDGREDRKPSDALRGGRRGAPAGAVPADRPLGGGVAGARRGAPRLGRRATM